MCLWGRRQRSGHPQVAGRFSQAPPLETWLGSVAPPNTRAETPDSNLAMIWMHRPLSHTPIPRMSWAQRDRSRWRLERCVRLCCRQDVTWVPLLALCVALLRTPAQPGLRLAAAVDAVRDFNLSVCIYTTSNHILQTDLQTPSGLAVQLLKPCSIIKSHIKNPQYTA